jgi:hypothetical protein
VTYRVFISHAWNQQSDYYYGLVELLRKAPRLDPRNLSVPRQRRFDGDYEEAKAKIYAALELANVVLVVDTAAVTRSKAVLDELAQARLLGIPIVVVSPPNRHGAISRATSLENERYRAKWTRQSIAKKIREAVRATRAAAKRAERRREKENPIVLFPSLYEPIEDASQQHALDRNQMQFMRGDDEDIERRHSWGLTARKPGPREVPPQLRQQYATHGNGSARLVIARFQAIVATPRLDSL